MSKTVETEHLSQTVKKSASLLLALITAVPMFFLVHIYSSAAMEGKDDEEIAILLTVYFLVGVYAGRFMAQMWIARHKIIPRRVFIPLVVTLVLSLILLFLAAQFSLVLSKIFMRFLVVLIPYSTLSLVAGILIKLVRYTVKTQIQEAKANAEQSHSELKFLQTQLSPHFLFNTLNNIYGISLSQHQKIPELLLKLSSLLRYSVYDVKELFVPLKSEMEYISNYIDFEKIRIGDKLVLITSFDEDINPDIKIAPLLLIVFIENAFKHGKNTSEQNIYIDITLRIWGNSILFSVRNSNNGATDEYSIVNKSSGFGLENVMKRLDLLYSNEYDLKMQNKDGFYNVMLQLKGK